MRNLILLFSTIGSLVTTAAMAQEPVCFRVSPTGQLVDLTSVCQRGKVVDPIGVSNLSLEVPEAEFLSSRVKATITNRSRKPILVSVVRLQIQRADVPVVTVPIAINQTFQPGQSILASGLFDRAALGGQKPSELTVRLQTVQ